MSGQTITTYFTLEQALQDWLARSDIDDTNYLPELIQMAESNIYDGFIDNKGNYWPGLRVRQMENTLSGNISSSNTFAVPSDYLEMKYLYATISSNSVLLNRKSADWIYANYGPGFTGAPTYFARDGSNFIFGPYSDSQYALTGLYYQKATLLSSTNTTDWIITNHPNLLLAACLAEVSAFIKDDMGVQYWQNKAAVLMNTIQQADNRERFSGSPITAVPA